MESLLCPSLAGKHRYTLTSTLNHASQSAGAQVELLDLPFSRIVSNGENHCQVATVMERLVVMKIADMNQEVRSIKCSHNTSTYN